MIRSYANQTFQVLNFCKALINLGPIRSRAARLASRLQQIYNIILQGSRYIRSIAIFCNELFVEILNIFTGIVRVILSSSVPPLNLISDIAQNAGISKGGVAQNRNIQTGISHSFCQGHNRVFTQTCKQTICARSRNLGNNGSKVGLICRHSKATTIGNLYALALNVLTHVSARLDIDLLSEVQDSRILYA